MWLPLSDELLTALRFATLSYLLFRWRRRRESDGEWVARVVSITTCTLLAGALEATQFLIESRAPSGQDLLAAATGVVLGVLVTPLVSRWVRPTVLVTAATAIAAAPFYLAPFDVASNFSSIAMVPFLAYYQFTSLQTVSHVIELMAIYAPIGFAIAWSRSDRAVARVLLVVAPVAATLEYAQGWIVGRFPDVTDVGMALLGGMIGAVIAQSATPANGQPYSRASVTAADFRDGRARANNMRHSA
jgi:VanZ family protein